MSRFLSLILAFLAGCGAAGDTTDGGIDGSADAGPCLRWVLEGEVTNARDLGDWAVSGGTVRCRTIFRGGTLAGLSGSGCGAFQALDIRTIVDLRDASTQGSAPPPACATEGASLVLAPMPKLLPDTTQTYLALLEEGESIRRVFEALGAAGAYPAYVHCEIGRARASFVTALVLLALGAERSVILEEFDLSNDVGVEAVAAHLEAVMDEIAARGGIAAFLESVGVTPGALQALRQIAVEGL